MVVSGLVLHPLEAAARSIAIPETSRGDAHLRSVGEFLQVLIARDRRSLQIPRKSEHRLFGVCRDYALIACSILRTAGIPARLRVGFADYFTPHYLEDHWVCEYRDGHVWRLLDAELAPDIRSRYSIAFEAHDVPRQRFLSPPAPPGRRPGAAPSIRSIWACMRSASAGCGLLLRASCAISRR